MKVWLLQVTTSSQLRRIKKGPPRRVWWDVYAVRHLRRTETAAPEPEDLVAIACWPGMRKTADLVPAWQDAMQALQGRRHPLEDYPALLRSLRFWRVRHPISDAPLTTVVLKGELEAVLAAPRAYIKRPWREVLQQLGMQPSGLSYVRREVAAFKTRVRTVLKDPALAKLIAQVEKAMPDRRGRPKKRGEAHAQTWTR